MKLILFILLVSNLSFAAKSGNLDPNYIPVNTIILQCINLSLLAILLHFLVRPKLVSAFKGRKEAFLNKKRQAENQRKQAEDVKKEISEKLNAANSTYDEVISKARKEATEMKSNIISNAELQIAKIHKSAELAKRAEIEKAISEIREELLQESLDLAVERIAKNIESDDQSRLQKNFVSNVGVIQ